MPTRRYTGTAFFAQNEDNYRRLWQIIGRDWTDLATEAAWAAANIPGEHHGDLKITLTAAQLTSMLPVLTVMGFFDEATFPHGDYDELNVSGAKFGAQGAKSANDFGGMVGRWRELRLMLDTGLYRFRRATCLFGVRPREDKLDGTLEEITKGISFRLHRHPWVQRELGLDVPFETEWHLGILAVLIAYDGAVRVEPYEPSGDTTHLPDVPFREAASTMLRLPNGMPVLVLNCPAVERPGRSARPTTDSTTAYWLDRYPPAENAQVVMVFGPTHWYRQAASAEDRIHRTRPDVVLYASSRATPHAGLERLIPNAIAEAVWLLKRAASEA